MANLVPPQLVVNSRMLYFTWVPADPDAVRKLLHPKLNPIGNQQCFINQYVVDDADQTSNFGAYSLTYAGADTDRFAPDGEIPTRWWTHYFNSSEDMRGYASERGVPAVPGETTLEIADGILTASTSTEGVEVIRTAVRVGEDLPVVGRGQLSYVTEIDGRLVDGIYPFVAPLAQPWEVLSFEFLAPDHSVYALRPASPLNVTWGFYSPAASFCYPGGENVLDV
ncbi:MAG: hypothetical protein H6531_00795 [Actinobacteria bacterium]|nr:hypothetical protein [Thermoleophilia bacterium]MCB9010352.1 hypothetical protein [Actinomycetota bacterium]